MAIEDLKNIKRELETELFNSVIPFWQKHSIDKVNGGYYNCLDSRGNIFDTTKYMWLHGRQIWMFSKLYNNHYQNDEWLQIATHGIEFMKNNAKLENGRVYFSLNETGQPVYLQRKVFSECFFAMALSEYGKAKQDESYIAEAKSTLQRIWKMIQDPLLVGRPIYKGESSFQTLAVPMILLNLIEEIYGTQFKEVEKEVYECIDKIKKHCKNGLVYENVLKNGDLVDSSEGRLLNPGHAIEAGWFLLRWSQLLNDLPLMDTGKNMIRNMFDLGWDNEFGGLYYFLDANNCPPAKLEWNMKLWWPHCESLYAFLLLYTITNEKEDFDTFLKVKNYCFTHFRDKEYGEWFGYLNRDGSVSLSLKGGPYKGCFHLPRALFNCIAAIENLK